MIGGEAVQVGRKLVVRDDHRHVERGEAAIEVDQQGQLGFAEAGVAADELASFFAPALPLGLR
jgi:hypothetical protein